MTAADTLVVVTGYRAYRYPHAVWKNLNALYVKLGPFTLYHGACTPRGSEEMVGADRFADDWADMVPDVEVRRFKADWALYDNAAGPIRNRLMVSTGVLMFPRERIHGLAFPGLDSRGTWNCVKIMKEFGIKPDVWDYARVREELPI